MKKTVSLLKQNAGLFAGSVLLWFLFPATFVYAQAPVIDEYEIIATYPHDTRSFTQGLVYQDGRLFESTGRFGQSRLLEAELETGKIIREHRLDDHHFGEGLVYWQNRLIQLTWRAGLVFVYDADTFERLETLSNPEVGWGLALNQRGLLHSDGSDVIYVRDPETFIEIDRLEVQDGGQAVTHINELEALGDTVLANIWKSDYIAHINLEDGSVLQWIDLSALRPASTQSSSVSVLNGIAYRPEREHLLVTGKLWPVLYEIKVPALSTHIKNWHLHQPNE